MNKVNRGVVARSLLAAVLGTAAVAGSGIAPAMAQAAQTRSFAIPAQSLVSALARFTETSGVQFFFDAAIARNIQSPGVSGSLTPEAALARLLDGTGLTYRFTNPTTVTLVEAPRAGSATVLPSISVEGRAQTETPTGPVEGYAATVSASAMRMAAPLLDTPQSVRVIGAQEIRDRGYVNAVEAVENVSGVQWTGNTPLVRGFGSEFARNGSTFSNNVLRSEFYSDTVNVERIEVVKGATAVLGGRSAPGGIVNIITKKPLAEPRYEAGATVGTENFYKPFFDLSIPITPDGKTQSRLIGSYETSESFRDFFERDEKFLYSSTTLQVTDTVKLSLELTHQRIERSQDFGLFANANGVIDVPHSRWLGEPGDFVHYEQNILSFGVESSLNDRWTLKNSATVLNFKQEENGLRPASLAADNRTLRRQYRDVDFDENNLALNNELTGKFELGGMMNELLIGVDSTLASLEQRFYTGANTGNLLDIYNPVYGGTINRAITNCGCDSREYRAAGLVVQNQTHLTDWLIASYGARFDYMYSDRENLNTRATLKKTDREVSPRFGLVVKPLTNLSLYASYVEGFQSNVPFTAQAGGAPFPSETSQQKEVGFKLDSPDSRLSLSASVYELTRQNVATADPANPGSQIAVGEQRSRGFETDIVGRVTPEIDVTAAYAYTQALVTRDNTTPVGNELALIPRHQASLWGKYTIRDGEWKNLGFGAGALYVGEREGNLANQYELGSYVRFDAAAYYTLGTLDLVLSVQNIFDREYFSASAGDSGNVLPGRPRTVWLTARKTF